MSIHNKQTKVRLEILMMVFSVYFRSGPDLKEKNILKIRITIYYMTFCWTWILQIPREKNWSPDDVEILLVWESTRLWLNNFLGFSVCTTCMILIYIFIGKQHPSQTFRKMCTCCWWWSKVCAGDISMMRWTVEFQLLMGMMSWWIKRLLWLKSKCQPIDLKIIEYIIRNNDIIRQHDNDNDNDNNDRNNEFIWMA